MFFIYCAKA